MFIVIRNGEANKKAIVKTCSGLSKGKVTSEHYDVLWDSLSSASPAQLPGNDSSFPGAASDCSTQWEHALVHIFILPPPVQISFRKGAGIWSTMLLCSSLMSVKVEINFDTPKKRQTACVMRVCMV